VDHGGFGGFGYVFGNEAEVCASSRAAGGKLGFAGKLMGDFGVSSHLASVVKSSLSEGRIKAERLESPCGSVLISSGKKILFGYVWSGGRRRGGEDWRTKSCCGEEHERLMGVASNPTMNSSAV
jgi:hypothetical protein